MSKQQIQAIVNDLPSVLASQIIGYVESVERVSTEIFRDAKVKYSEDIENKLLFIAGLKKLVWLAESSYWTLDTSGKLLSRMDTGSIRIGGKDLSRGGEIHQSLERLLKDMTKVLIDKKINEYIHMPLKEIVREINKSGH